MKERIKIAFLFSSLLLCTISVFSQSTLEMNFFKTTIDSQAAKVSSKLAENLTANRSIASYNTWYKTKSKILSEDKKEIFYLYHEKYTIKPKSYSGLIIGGGMMSVAGAVFLGAGIGLSASDDEFHPELIVPGAVLLIGGITMSAIGKSKRRNSLASYKNINLENLGFIRTRYTDFSPYVTISLSFNK